MLTKWLLAGLPASGLLVARSQMACTETQNSSVWNGLPHAGRSIHGEGQSKGIQAPSQRLICCKASNSPCISAPTPPCLPVLPHL